MQVSNLEQSNKGFCLAAHSLMVGGGDDTVINTTRSLILTPVTYVMYLLGMLDLKSNPGWVSV